MNIPGFFISRPVAALLLTAALTLAGLVAYRHLPVAALPRIDIPTISVSTALPGATPETVATTISTPLIREFSAIPSVREISATNIQGASAIVLEFALERDIDLAAADVQAAIARTQPHLPVEMTGSPVYRKLNPADAPVVLIVLRSDTHLLQQLDTFARTVISPRLSAIAGVAQVTMSGSQKYAVRVQLDPLTLAARGIGVDEVERAVQAANAHTSAGVIRSPDQHFNLEVSTQLGDAQAWRDLIIAHRNGRPLRLGDVARVIDSVEDDQRASWHNGSPALILAVQRQPDANTIEVVDKVRAALPRIREELGPGVSLTTMNDRSISIRTALDDVTFTLVLTIGLVCAVLYLGIGRLTTTFIPSVTIPVSIVATFAAMYALDMSLDNITLLALTLSVGLVVDDAIVVTDNIVRRIEAGAPPHIAALKGAKEIAFTVISITASLIAAFIPLLLMDGVVGRILSPFAITVSVALAISALVSLSLTPMLTARMPGTRGRVAGRQNLADRAMSGLTRGYGVCLDLSLRVRPLMLILFLISLIGSGWLLRTIPKGFLPQEDIGQILISTRARQDVSFPAMVELQRQVEQVLRTSPHVSEIVSEIGATGTTSLNEGRLSVELKAKAERPSLAQVLADLRRDLDQLPGIESLVTTAQNARMGSQSGRGPYQMTVQAQTLTELQHWSARLAHRMSQDAMFVGVRSDAQETALQVAIRVDHDKARQFGITSEQLRSTLRTGFAARQAATIHGDTDSYRVLIEFDPRVARTMNPLELVSIRSASGVLVPLSSFATIERTAGPRSIAQLGQRPVATISFDTPAGIALSEAVNRIDALKFEEGVPATVTTGFAGTARVFQDMVHNQPLLLAAAILTIYLVLGMLYESLVHPVTILAGLPAAAFGAVAALQLAQMELSIMGLIGILLLFGIVKKNAIMMVDHAIVRQREGLSPSAAIREACLIRFRPIMMTTAVALAGAIPIAVGHGAGSELRQPLGIAVIGGLIVSQLLTLFITPVLYLYLERLAGIGRRLVWISKRHPA
ncbi:efflux RND transporter permease subunit [Microvirga makkahensis]|uniref:Acriflavine resistance protein B n=1 Tax=Microvirga makkahensis TaxID=1128670 RepID=A0A7X3MTR3_9HYPH|nr:efflux RND transporter permease subunit [Microvirga makkahensis]MXQ13091.1 acriflavine resistance protein B [Microvirga makkahensis]